MIVERLITTLKRMLNDVNRLSNDG